MRPMIGITCNFDDRDDIGRAGQAGVSGRKWHFLSDNYIEAIEKAGGIPVMIPLYGDLERAKEMAERLDGLLVSGGNDIDPRRYGERARACCGRILPERDEQDIGLVKFLLEKRRKPILGICRGAQVLNVAAGGTLYQDLEQEGNFGHHFMGVYPMNRPVHKVRVKAGSGVFGIFGKEILETNSFHHQGVKEVAEGFEITASSEEGVVEAIEKKDGSFVVGIQWHPEMMYDSGEQQAIFRAFVKASQGEG